MDDNPTTPAEGNESFDIPQERIDEMIATVNTVGEYLTVFRCWHEWAVANLHQLDAEEVAGIYKEFVDSNKHLIERINKMYPSSTEHNLVDNA